MKLSNNEFYLTEDNNIDDNSDMIENRAKEILKDAIKENPDRFVLEARIDDDFAKCEYDGVIKVESSFALHDTEKDVDVDLWLKDGTFDWSKDGTIKEDYTDTSYEPSLGYIVDGLKDVGFDITEEEICNVLSKTLDGKFEKEMERISDDKDRTVVEAFGNCYGSIKLYDSAAPGGGKAHSDERLGEFMDETEMKPTDSVYELRQALYECGIEYPLHEELEYVREETELDEIVGDADGRVGSENEGLEESKGKDDPEL